MSTPEGDDDTSLTGLASLPERNILVRLGTFLFYLLAVGGIIALPYYAAFGWPPSSATGTVQKLKDYQPKHSLYFVGVWVSCAAAPIIGVVCFVILFLNLIPSCCASMKAARRRTQGCAQWIPTPTYTLLGLLYAFFRLSVTSWVQQYGDGPVPIYYNGQNENGTDTGANNLAFQTSMDAYQILFLGMFLPWHLILQNCKSDFFIEFAVAAIADSIDYSDLVLNVPDLKPTLQKAIIGMNMVFIVLCTLLTTMVLPMGRVIARIAGTEPEDGAGLFCGFMKALLVHAPILLLRCLMGWSGQRGTSVNTLFVIKNVLEILAVVYSFRILCRPGRKSNGRADI